jgi:membrane protein implicated in regulation of membrane protease activity
MTDGAAGPVRGQDRPQPVGSGLRSPVWLWLAQGFLVALYGLAPAIVQQFLLSALGDSLLWRRLGQVLRWLSYAVIAIAIVYALYHAYVVIRARRRDTRDLQLTADLTAPGREVRLVERHQPDKEEQKESAPRWPASDQGRRLLSGLWPLRAHALGIDAVLSVQAALSEAPDRLPLEP